MNIDELHELLVKIRLVFESWSKTNEGGVYIHENFPKACCGSSSDLLTYYLSKYHNQHNILYKMGMIGTCCHAWIEVNGYSIDITADQFNKLGYNYPSIICCRSYDYPLLSKLKKISVGGGFNSNDPDFSQVASLANKLNRIISTM